MADALDVARALFRAANDEDLAAVAALYHPQVVAEHVFAGLDDSIAGAAAIAGAWRDEFARSAGGFPGGHRYDVTRVAGIETGWGWARAEWTSMTVDRGTGVVRAATGYSHFWIEDGLIRRHRTIARDVPPAALRAPRQESERRYPTRPLIGVGAIILSNQREVVIVKRKHEPLAGQWSLPGGMLELGETLEAGVAREMLEETGLHVTVGPVIEVFDRILLDDAGKVRYHFVLIDYICHVRGGTLAAGSDVEAAAWASEADLDRYLMAEKPRSVIAQALSATSVNRP